MDLRAAIWGGLVVHWACWAILDRAQANVSLPQYLDETVPNPLEPSCHWSIDLLMAAWPNVDARCKRVSEDDPLKTTLHEIAMTWPLSAIGINLDNDVILTSILPSAAWRTILGHRSLRQIAFDRAERSGENTFSTYKDTHESH